MSRSSHIDADGALTVRSPTASVRSIALRYGVAVIVPLLASYLTSLFLGDATSRYPFLLFFPAVNTIGILAGTGPGLLATAIAVLLACMNLPPAHSLLISSPQDRFALLTFAGTTALTLVCIHFVHRARERLAVKHRDADHLAERLRVALAVAPMHLYTNDRSLRYTAIANPLSGFTSDMIVGKRDDELLPPDTVAELMAFKQRVIDTGKPARGDIVIRLPDGRRLDYDVSAEPLFDTSNHVTGVVVAALDVSSRAQAMQRAIRSERLLQLLLDNTPAIIFAKDSARRMRWVNTKFADLLGKTPEEVMGKHQLELFPPEQLQAIFENDDKAFAGTAPLVFEETLHFKDGARVYHSVKLPFELEGERLLFGFSQDITQQRRDEAAIRTLNRDLQRRIAELESLLQVIPVGIGIAEDPECRRIRINPAFGRLLDLPVTANASLTAPEDQKPRHFKCYVGNKVVPPEDLPLQRASREGVTVEGEVVDVVHENGRRVRLLEYAAPLFDEEGKPRGAVGAFVDVSERLAAEERFRLLADAAPILVWIADASGSRVWFNKPWQDYTGRGLGELVNDGWIADLHPDDLDRYVTRYRAALSAREPFSLEYRLRQRFGGYRWILARARPLFEGPAGAYSGHIGVCLDIQDIKVLQREKETLLDSEHRARLAAEQAQQDAVLASRMKDEFLATLSHELRTPLNAIIGWLEILHSAAEASPTGLPSAADYHEGIETIRRNAQGQAQLIEDLLDMSRIISGRIRLDLKPTDLAQCVEVAVKNLLPTAQAKRVHLYRSLPIGLIVSADPDRLQQVVLNLLSNAIKFTPESGQISVTLATDEQPRYGEGSEDIVRYAVLTVSDTGQGIDPDFLPHVFDRFRQADGSSTRRHGGLGLGLALVKQLTELHGGTVAAHSAGKDRGATFVIRLPLLLAPPTQNVFAPDAPANPVTTPPLPLQLPPATILLTEDDTDTRAVVRRILLEAGAARVDTAPDVDTALAYLSLNTYHLLVSDISMPNRDGYDLISAMRASHDNPNRLIPALALTALAREEDRQRAFRSGFTDHVPKPLDRPKLLLAAQRLLVAAFPAQPASEPAPPVPPAPPDALEPTPTQA